MTPVKPSIPQSAYTTYEVQAKAEQDETANVDMTQAKNSKAVDNTLGKESLISQPRDMIFQSSMFGAAAETAIVPLMVISSLLGSLVTICIQHCMRSIPTSSSMSSAVHQGGDTLGQARERLLPS